MSLEEQRDSHRARFRTPHAKAKKSIWSLAGSVSGARAESRDVQSNLSGPQVRQGYPLNLSILISGGKETNKDSPSNGE